MSELANKITQNIKASRCNRKGCLSQQRDPLEIVWFGTQYGASRDITCSACYVCNQEAVKNSLLTNLNVLPVTIFVDKFVAQMKTYQILKSSPDFFPKVMKQKSTQILQQVLSTEKEVLSKLQQLARALAQFSKKVTQSNLRIGRHEIFQEIILGHNEGNYKDLLDKIKVLIVMMNVKDEQYHFERVQERQKKQAKLAMQIEHITKRTGEVLLELTDILKQNNELISQI